MIEDDRSGPAEAPTPGTSTGPSFRTRLTVALIASAVIPLVGFGIVVLLIGPSFDADADDGTVARSTLIFAIAVVAAMAIVTSYVLASELTAPLRAIARSVDRVSAGDRSAPIVVAGDDELARLAESHNRLSSDLDRRNRELERILAAIDEVSPRDDVEALVTRTAADAQSGLRADRRDRRDGEPGDPRGRGGRTRRLATTARRAPCRWGGPWRDHRPAAGHPALGTRGPGPPGAVRQRDGRGHPERAAVRHGREPERAASGAGRGQGRLPPWASATTSRRR